MKFYTDEDLQEVLQIGWKQAKALMRAEGFPSIRMLEAPAVMSVDTSQVEGDLGNALSLLQQFQEAQNNVELQTAVGADTSEAQGKVDSLVSEIQGLSPEIQAQLNIDTTSEATITSSIQALTPEIMVKAGVDSAVVDAWAAEEKKSDGTVKWKNDTGTVDAWAAQMHTSNGTVSWTNDVSQVKTTFTATGTVNWTNTKHRKNPIIPRLELVITRNTSTSLVCH